MTREPADMRVLAAVRAVDAALGAPILSRLVVTAEQVRIIRNRSGLYVIAGAPGTEAYTARFQLPVPPAAPVPPPVGSVEIALSIADPSGRYLPRSATIRVPRDPDPAHRDQAGSLWTPIDVELFPSPTRSIGDGWATLRLSIKRAGSQLGLPFAFVRVRRASDDSLLGRGLADERGEALIGIPGIPVTTWSTTPGSPVTTSTIQARVAACFDRDAFDPATGTYPDPAELEAAFATLPHSTEVELDLASGHEVTRRIDVVVPP